MAVNLMEALGAAEQSIQDRITIYIPSRDQNGEAIELEDWVKQAMELLSQIGCLRRRGHGSIPRATR